MRLCPAVRRLLKAWQYTYQCVSQKAEVTFGVISVYCIYLSLRIEVSYKAHSLTCCSIPGLVLWMLWIGSWMMWSCWITLPWMCCLCGLLDCFLPDDCCYMYLGNPSTLVARQVLYSLLPTVNNKLMCKADFCGCVVPHPGLCTEAALPHMRHIFVMHWLIAICGEGTSSGKYYNSRRGVGIFRGLSEHCLAKLHKLCGSHTLTRPRLSKLLTRSEGTKWYILPRSTAVFSLHRRVF